MATIKTLSSGKQEIRDPSNRLLGTFEPKSNDTRYPNSPCLATATGSVRARLIGPAEAGLASFAVRICQL